MANNQQTKINSESQDHKQLLQDRLLKIDEIEDLSVKDLKSISGGLLPGTGLFGHMVVGEC